MASAGVSSTPEVHVSAEIDETVIGGNGTESVRKTGLLERQQHGITGEEADVLPDALARAGIGDVLFRQQRDRPPVHCNILRRDHHDHREEGEGQRNHGASGNPRVNAARGNNTQDQTA